MAAEFFTLPLEMESRSKPSLRMGLRKDFLLIYMQSTDRYIIHFMMPRPFSLSLSLSSCNHRHTHSHTRTFSRSEGSSPLSLCGFLCLYFGSPLARCDPKFLSLALSPSLSYFFSVLLTAMTLFVPFFASISQLQFYF